MATQLPYGITRAQLVKAVGGDETIARALEKVILQVAENQDVSTAAVEATVALQDATNVTLSPNDALSNERILAVASPLALQDGGPGNHIIIGFTFAFTVPVAHAFNMNLLADTNITMPPFGRLLASDITNAVYANDAAAGVAGLVVGEVYRGPTGTVVWKQT